MGSNEGMIHYRPLDRSRKEVRLLELQPPSTGDVNERVVCRLVHERLGDETSDFIGLSSLYGDISVTESILLNGSRVTVPGNIAQALRYMRAVFLGPNGGTTPNSSKSDLKNDATTTTQRSRPAPSGNVPPKKPPGWLKSLLKGVRNMFDEPSRSDKRCLRVWIDVLCINRRDAKEDAAQRSHRHLAYQHAKMVVGWLGTKDATSDLAIEIIRAWDKCMPLTFGEPGDKEAHPENYAPRLQWMGPVAHLSNIPEGVTDPRDVPSYKAVSSFLNRPYFHSGWILEDMAMAKFPAFLLGDDIVSWMQILRLNRVNEDIKDNGADMFPDELRPLLEYMPLGSVYTFLKEFDTRQREVGITLPAMLAATKSVRSSESMSSLPRTQ